MINKFQYLKLILINSISVNLTLIKCNGPDRNEKADKTNTSIAQRINPVPHET